MHIYGLMFRLVKLLVLLSRKLHWLSGLPYSGIALNLLLICRAGKGPLAGPQKMNLTTLEGVLPGPTVVQSMDTVTLG